MEEIEKMYFKIGEVAEMFNVNASLLRYWETQFSEIKPFKNKKGDRYYTKNDVETIRTIHYLTKIKGYKLKGVKEALQNNREASDKNAQIVEKLSKIKDFLIEIKDNL
ncbi:MAG: MerR family transcriptional regulator [Bacteroidales bacterium]|nr:MerR family transcriptional regulator [Bacteroidales bacterium]MBQ7490061.1 MerR family transcriptional regulator [Bacteroidales bacterium]